MDIPSALLAAGTQGGRSLIVYLFRVHRMHVLRKAGFSVSPQVGYPFASVDEVPACHHSRKEHGHVWCHSSETQTT